LHGNPKSDVDGQALALHYRQLHGLGWWRAMKGNQWPDKRSQTSEITGQKSAAKVNDD